MTSGTCGAVQQWHVEFEFETTKDRAVKAATSELDPVVVPLPAQLDHEAMGEQLEWLVHQVVTDALQQTQAWQPLTSSAPIQQQDQLEALSAELQQLRGDYDQLEYLWQDQKEQIGQLQADKDFLEKTLREIPGIYRRKFEERLLPVRERIHALEWENRQLKDRLQQLTQPPSVATLEDIDTQQPSIWSLWGRGSAALAAS